MAVITRPRIKAFLVPRVPQDFWEWLLLQNDFRTAITKQGFYEIEKLDVISTYKEWFIEKRKLNYEVRSSKATEYNIPQSLSVDFLSQTPRVLDSNDLYTLPTGHGNCVVFDRNVFPLPYLKTTGHNSDAAEIPVRIKSGFRNLVDSLSAHWNEQSFLRALHFCGAFASIVKKICNADRYQCGASGHLASCFPFWVKDAKRNKLVRFVYEGVVDLDECLYPKDTNIVIPIEAKIDCGHYRLAWHKLAFPAYRFIDNSKAIRTFRTGSSIHGIYNSKVRIVPVYCLFNPSIKAAYICIFPQLVTHSGSRHDCPEYGVILNERVQMVPKSVFEVKMDWI